MTSIASKIHSNIDLLFMLSTSYDLFLVGLSVNILKALLPSPMLNTCPVSWVQISALESCSQNTSNLCFFLNLREQCLPGI